MKRLMRAVVAAAAASFLIIAQLFFAAPKTTAAATAKLSAIYINSGNLTPAFSPDVTDYTLDVKDVSSLMIKPVPADPRVLITINGAPYEQDTYYSVDLTLGTLTIVIDVKNKDGEAKRYTISVNSASSSDAAGLSGLTVDCGALTPEFNTDTLNYTLYVENSVTRATITTTAISASQAISINGRAVESGEGFSLPLSVGENSAVITVVNYDGSSKTYVLTITRASPAGPPAGLSALFVSPGTLCPKFDANTLSYTVSVENGVSSVSIAPIPLNGSLTVTVNGEPVTNGEDFVLPLAVGENTAVITVRSPAGSVKTYVVTIFRAQSAVALKSLVISAGALSPAFNPSIYSYFASVENNVTKIYVSAAATDPAAVVKVNGGSSGNVSLNVGYNTVTVTVSDSTGTVKNYTITVFRKYNTEIEAASPDSSGAFRAAVPDYLSLLGDGDTVTFILGGNKIVMPASTLKNYKAGGGLTVSLSEISNADLSKASAAADANRFIAGGVNVGLSGGGAADYCYINASATLKLNSNIKSALKSGVPELYYFNPASNSLVKIDADFDLSAGTVTFPASLCGSYIFAAALAGGNVNYTVIADSHYTDNSFSVRIVRQSDSVRLSDARILVITTLSSGSQVVSILPFSGDSCSLSVKVGAGAVKSSVYLINGPFDGAEIPASYALVQFVSA